MSIYITFSPSHLEHLVHKKTSVEMFLPGEHQDLSLQSLKLLNGNLGDVKQESTTTRLWSKKGSAGRSIPPTRKPLYGRPMQFWCNSPIPVKALALSF